MDVDATRIVTRKIGAKGRISIGDMLPGLAYEYKGGQVEVLVLGAKKPEKVQNEEGD